MIYGNTRAFRASIDQARRKLKDESVAKPEPTAERIQAVCGAIRDFECRLAAGARKPMPKWLSAFYARREGGDA